MGVLSQLRRKWLIGAAALALVLVAGALALVLGGGEDERVSVVQAPPQTERADPPDPNAPAEDHDHGRDDPDHPPDEEDLREPPGIDEDTLSPIERAAARTVRAYVKGLDDRDGDAVCELLVAGAIDAVDLPRGRGDCGGSLSASIGYRDPRGAPVWDSARVHGLLTVAIDGDRASVTATTITRFADRDEPSVEDDVVHLVREGDRWLIAKASSTLYRAVGIADVPPQALAPPR